jgi:hypothetical protein
MTPTRQVAAAKFMLSTGNYSKSFAKALLVATNPAGRVTSRIRPIPGLSADMKDDMQRELKHLLNDLTGAENYGADVLSLVVASGYVTRLIENKAIEDYLSRTHPDILQEFRAIAATVSLDDVRSTVLPHRSK